LSDFLNLEVLDPRLKLGYYEDHGWEEDIVDKARSMVCSTYKSNYERSDEPMVKAWDRLDAHIYGRKKGSATNEIEKYLEEQRVILQEGENTLSWWKVSVFI
jgi:hypothetical protein